SGRRRSALSRIPFSLVPFPLLLSRRELQRPRLERLAVDGGNSIQEFEYYGLKLRQRSLELDFDRPVAVVVGDREVRRRAGGRSGPGVVNPHPAVEGLCVHVARELDSDFAADR